MTEYENPIGEPRWLDWAKRLQAVAQDGLAYANNPFDLKRYETIREVAAEILAAQTGAEMERILDVFAHQVGYPTPKVDVRGVVIRDDGRILMVREGIDGRWSLPGGWADVSETPSRATEREILEEAGYVARAGKLLAVYDRTLHGHEPPYPFHVYKLFFRCQLLDERQREERDVKEILDAGWFAEDALPPLSLGRVTGSQLHRMFEHVRDPGLPTDFD
jgi:ADP-ribose pyrophosphatase YjhB (NUDIX family)